jgi:hypothetical protein
MKRQRLLPIEFPLKNWDLLPRERLRTRGLLVAMGIAETQSPISPPQQTNRPLGKRGTMHDTRAPALETTGRYHWLIADAERAARVSPQVGTQRPPVATTPVRFARIGVLWSGRPALVAEMPPHRFG